MKLTLAQLNAMSRADFVRALKDIFEHSPWVAEAAYDAAPFVSVGALHTAMLDSVRNAGEERMLALFRAHPDLATKLAIGELSAKEQQGAGLNKLTPEEFETFSGLNRAYVDKFGFPFLFAVRGKTKDDILEAMRRRLPRSAEQEKEQALVEIARITGFRLADLLGGTGRGKLTTHVLDTARGRPASGMKLQLWNRSASPDAPIREAETNADGRLDAPLLAGAAMQPGVYELVFAVGDYFRRTQPDAVAFLDEVPIRFVVDSPSDHYHVPLLVAPGGYSTYRGS